MQQCVWWQIPTWMLEDGELMEARVQEIRMEMPPFPAQEPPTDMDDGSGIMSWSAINGTLVLSCRGGRRRWPKHRRTSAS